MKVKQMLMGIVTIVFISFGFIACTANEDTPSTPEQQPQQDYSAFEAYSSIIPSAFGTLPRIWPTDARLWKSS